MGISASWIAVKGMSKERALEQLGLVDTGEPVKEHSYVTSYAHMPAGWLAILTLDFEFPTHQRLAALSESGEAIGCGVEEHVMYSYARAYRDGKLSWSVEHDGGDEGTHHLKAEGVLPAQLEPIRERLWAEQLAEDAGEAVCDYMFSLPVELTYALTGFRADGEIPDEGEPVMTRLKEPPPARRAPTPQSGGLIGVFQRVFGRGKGARQP